jgi:alanine racemase
MFSKAAPFGLWHPMPAYAELGLRPVLCSVPEVEDWGQFCAVSGLRTANGEVLPAALTLDCGQNRLGLKAYDLERVAPLTQLFNLTLLLGQVSGDESAMARQVETFDNMCGKFPGRPASIANSSAIFLETNPLYDVVRPGFALYGGNPTPGRSNPMRPVVRLEAQIIQVRIIEPGQTVGEKTRWTAKGPRRIAMIAAGLADGIPASLTRGDNHSGGFALVQGQRCPFISDIAMDFSIIDVSDATYLERGEVVEIFGTDTTIDDFATEAGMSGYEILTHLGRRCHRRYLRF